MKTKLLFILSFVAVLLIISSFTNCYQSHNTGNMILPVPQYDNYEADWKKVSSYENQGLPKSALKVVEEIYQKAKKENNSPQFIKAIIYKIKLKSEFGEDFMEKAIADIQKQVKESSTPEKQILHSIEAELFWRYYKSNRRKFLDRTTTGNFDNSDIRTWDLRHLLNAIKKSYVASLENADLLKQTSILAYEAILDTAKNSTEYRPTLYDFLAHRAIDFFSNDESSIVQPAYRFEIDKKEYLADAKNFIKLKIVTKDSLSLKYYALTLYQDLTAFHLNDKKPTALVDVELQRLQFVNSNSVLKESDSLFLSSLEKIESEYSDYPVSTDAGFMLANLHFDLGGKYEPLVSDKFKWELKTAYDECNRMINRFPESKGAKNCKILKERIEKVSVAVTTEKVNIPYKPFLALVEYKNTNKLYFRVVKADYKEFEGLGQKANSGRAIIKRYLKESPVQSWEIGIPDDGDFQNHSTEVKMPAIQAGFYVLLVSPDNKFSYNVSPVNYGSFWMSNISYIAQKNSKGTYRFYTLDRETGKPMKGVKVKPVYKRYDYNTREYVYSEGEVLTSDDKGFIRMPEQSSGSRTNSFSIEFTAKNDRWITDQSFYQSYYADRPEKSVTKTWFFTDRSIYRPGQTIYFKGIVLEKRGDKYEIKPNFRTKVVFRDVNYQQISEIELTTNDYGSFQGTFTAPSGVLNGVMTIKNESGNANISVEEYKRPKFEVTFNPIEGSYKLNETVRVTGKAKAFAGNNIDNAQVKYRVVRKVTFPFWRYGFFGWMPMPMGRSMEITNGITTTDEDGNFEIEFKAIPGKTDFSWQKPVFNFEITADVTDINGETQSSATNVSVGQTALLIYTDIPDVVDKDNFTKFLLKTTNLNGHPEQATGKITISRLKEPSKLLVKRNWREPDVFIIPEDEFNKEFPHNVYKAESRPDKFQVEQVTASLNFDTKSDTVYSFDGISSWTDGRYVVEIETKDVFGQKVELKKYITLYSKLATHTPVNEIDWFHPVKTKCEPGEKTSFLIGTNDRNVRLLYEIVRKDEILHSEWLKLSEEQKLIEFPVKEEYRGGFTVTVVFVKHNRSFEHTVNVDVPFTNKELVFEFETFRNKLVPGQNEEWGIKIKGKLKDSVAAELLASMYDESLDAFKSHNWAFNLYGNSYGSISWQATGAFPVINLRVMSPSYQVESPVEQQYDKLNWFGFNYYGPVGFGRGMYDKSMALPGRQMDMSDDLENVSNLENIVEENAAPPAEETSQKTENKNPGFQLRRDFRETAFFYPSLKTNEKGEVIIAFKAPESLTRWKLMGLAHTKDLKYGQFEKEVITQKELMVIPNAPRFFRQGDKMTFSAKVVNLSQNELTGNAVLQFFDARTMKDITPVLDTKKINGAFTVTKGNSSEVGWEITIPEGFEVVTYRIKAQAGNFTDGEEKAIPVLTNRMLVTESLPLPVKGNETKKFRFEKLLISGNSKSITNFKYTLEFSSNPAWYAVQALPYMMESEHESADDVFARFYANSIASHIVKSSPQIKRIFDTWKNFTPDALLSNLEKNEELKSVILEETPWVLEAGNETERKQRVALLFDVNRMANELESSFRLLMQKQSPNGGWPWFEGMRESRNVTQNIVAGFGHLQQLGIVSVWDNPDMRKMISKAINFLDRELKKDYDQLKQNRDGLKGKHIGSLQIQYLYARSFFINNMQIPGGTMEAFSFYRDQAKQYWLDQNIYMQGMIALASDRLGMKSLPSQIMASIKEHSLYSEEMGMYWRENMAGYFWYQAPIETQALMIEAFDEIMHDTKAVKQMKIWLLKQKQTQDWKTSKATAEAVYALLLNGSDWLANSKLAKITIGTETIDPLKLENTKVEAGTGYFKTSWLDGNIKPEMGNITVTNENENIAWGAVYWQYFEDLDKITKHETPLKLDKKLFVEHNTDAGPVIDPVKDGMALQVGDKIKVRIELRVDRDMEYVHMKDMRASAFEPVDALSGYRYRSGLGYYMNIKDASVNFFFDYLRKGTYVFEYPLVVSQKGDFSNGITTVQCMYAPEFTSHSEGVRIEVK